VDFAKLNVPCAQPPVGLFLMPPEAIADWLASPEVSPQGSASGLRLLTFYIRHAARHLSPTRLRRLEKARKLLTARLDRELKDRELKENNKAA
jgi:hypothetical protein